ncbi:VanZ family protein [Mitsuaria sp. WAJ17]|uniref:VanZ family protein n=1 Tax=Mitsuaria sp. WAJ17 TaxID=2761452 RepID=UPI0016012253|nr:VanZ family protein [Mitsuaria sp. WAJ17]MBB2484390.1 VanZ family protein [Mitsuaria sp. WAJ17]
MTPTLRRLIGLAPALFALTLFAVSYLALCPAPPRAADLGWDKLNHFSAFGMLTLLGSLAWPGRQGRLAGGLLAYGGLIEILQTQVPGRAAEWADLLADGIGILLGLGLLLVLRRLSGRKSA